MRTKLLCPKCKKAHQIEAIKDNGWVYRYCERCGWKRRASPYFEWDDKYFKYDRNQSTKSDIIFREVIFQEDNKEVE